MNKYLIHPQISNFKKICSRTCQQNMASFKNCPTPEGNFLPLPPTKKSHVKMASFKNCPHQKETILLQKKFKMSFFAIFCVFRDFYTFFVFLQFCCKKILNIFFRDFSRFSRFLRVFCVFAIFLWI